MHMPKTSKQKPALLPMPVKPTKTRLTKTTRDVLHRFMCEQFRARLDRVEIDKTLTSLVDNTNKLLRAKYPEADMPVLRKYKLVRVDTCLKFTVIGTERVFGVRFNQHDVLPGEISVVDIPCMKGCYSGDIYPCDAAFEALADAWEKQLSTRRTTIYDKEREYNGFLLACRYLEEVEAVVPLTEEIRKELGAHGRSLTVINPDILSRIKSDFAQGIAA
jgi:hypothetical protein